MHSRLIHSLAFFCTALAAFLVITPNGSLSFRRDAYERSHAVLALLSEIGRVETRHLTRRGST